MMGLDCKRKLVVGCGLHSHVPANIGHINCLLHVMPFSKFRGGQLDSLTNISFLALVLTCLSKNYGNHPS